MEAATKKAEDTSFAVSFTRRIGAPREQVFKLWTEAEHLAKWWGPVGFTAPVCLFEARPGGRIHIDMRGPDDLIYPMYGTVEEIVPPARLVLRCVCCGDDQGNPGIESITTVIFHAEEGFTRLELVSRVTKLEDFAREALDGMEQGWSESLARLAEAALSIEQI